MFAGVVIYFGFAVLTACASALSVAVPQGTGEIAVTAKYPGVAQGTVRIAIYAGDKTFLSRPFAVVEAPLNDGVAHGVFSDLPWGEYAISAYLDLDADGELDFTWFGAPEEPVGTSNDAKGSFGPPSYDDARFMFATATLAIGFTLACPVDCASGE